MILRSNPEVRRWFATPDKTRYQFDGGVVNASYQDKDAIPFIVVDGNVYIGDNEQSHFDLFIDNELDGDYSNPEEIHGRIWTDRKIVVTWENLKSSQALNIVKSFGKAGLYIGSYLYVCDVDFEGEGKGVVYAMPMDEFIAQNMSASDLPKMYERQGRVNNRYEDDDTAQFSYNGVSGRLGKYLSATWGDSIERDDSKNIMVSETAKRTVCDNYVKRESGKTIRISESQLRNIVKECIKSSLNLGK